MPMIDLSVVRGSLSPEASAKLVEELATILLSAERAPDTEFFREITWVYVHEIAADRLAVGGRPGGAPRFRVEISVPEGALSQRRKGVLITDVHAAVMSAAGLDAQSPEALHVWTLIREVPQGNWGAGGQVVHYQDLIGAASAERERTATSTAS
jgi:phenylpyruvate tautomerase PptA (4-oxalocrotonate tautomerase family)